MGLMTSRIVVDRSLMIANYLPLFDNDEVEFLFGRANLTFLFTEYIQSAVDYTLSTWPSQLGSVMFTYEYRKTHYIPLR